MSDYSTNASVNVIVNGQQAEETLANLKKHALDLTNEIARVAAAGDKVTLKKLRRELNGTKREIKEMESATMQVNSVLARLGKSTPQELQKALSTLTRQLEYMQRGTKEWDEQVAKIKLVKGEIAKVNSELARSQTFLERVNNAWEKVQVVATGALAAFTGLTMAGRKAVQTFADMDEQMANTCKYTGMTVEEVEKLNDRFKKMDTRTGRDALNELAQEAGRLGFNTMQDVQGYVEAADIINVALCDLGAGATQTIAKLSSIFRINEKMTTKEAMLSVGSAVNVLSQNCTAGKQFLVEFTQRMAGVGATAKMSVPDLLAFGATLDANGQKCEMSASNLGKLIMMLYQKPTELASAVGLDVKKFTDTLQHSTNDALIMFLEQIGKLGKEEGLSKLAPLFKQMNMSGVRMSQVLATLADHIDMVKWEQQEANKAFEEATSATREYNIFNNTAQAGIDKAIKRFKELTITLGEKLLPVMKHVITTSSMTMRLLSKMVDFVIKYHREILSVTAAIVAYKIAVNASKTVDAVHYALLVAKDTLMRIHKVNVLLAAAAYNKMTGNTVRANAAVKLLNKTMKMNPWGLIAAAIAAVVTAMVLYIKKSRELSAAQKALNDIKTEAAKKASDETQHINTLIKAANNERLSMEQRKKAVDELNRIIPNYNAQIDATTGKYRASKTALDEYLESLAKKYELEGAQEKLKELGEQKAALTLEKKTATENLEKAQTQSAATATTISRPVTTGGGGGAPVVTGSISSGIELSSAESKLKKVNAQLQAIEEQEKAIFAIYGDGLQKLEVDNINPINPNPDDEDGGNGGGDAATSKNKFQAEDDWKEREEALNRIAYAKGEADYEAYTQRMLQIQVDYNKKKLEHTDLVGNEQVTIEAAYEEALKKQRMNGVEGTVEAENRAYEALQTSIHQRYADGELSARQYQNAMELAELEHLHNIVNLYEEGSRERLRAEQNYHKTSLKYQQKHIEEDKRLQEQFRQQYFTNAYQTTDNESYTRDLKNLELVQAQMLKACGNDSKQRLKIEKAFQEAKYQLGRKYNVKNAKEMGKSFRSAMDDVADWLKSDGGQAFTESLDVVLSGMSSIFSGISDMIQAELDIETAKIEASYDAQISAAEGNKYKEVQLEQQKEKEIGKAKKEANRKMFAMQVIQAVAQTAMSAIAAYSSAAAIPVVGFVMAPIAAAMAIAAGAIQIASIKKQQEASEGIGYSKGGFTPKGPVDQEVGVVHAGEWVASQRLLANPEARAIVNTLDYAQRTNQMGSLKASDVSRSITAPQVIAQSVQDGKLDAALATTAAALSTYSKTMDNLEGRLREPFVTVNTVEGDAGIKKAQDEYNQMMRNITPKSHRK